MKQETTGKKKKWILPVAIAAAVLVIVGIVLAVIMIPWGQEEATVQSKLYWNVDRLENLDPESGFTKRAADADGLYTIRFSVEGEQVELKCADKRLVNIIDMMDLMGLQFDADGLIVDAVAPETVANQLAKEYFVYSMSDTTLTLNSSMAMNGMSFDYPLSENATVYDVTPEAEVVGAPGEVGVMDKVTVFGNEAGEVTHIYRLTATVEAEVYHRIYRKYDKVNKVTSRVPENGVYTIEFAHKGQQVNLQCKNKELVNNIDKAYDAGAQMGLIFDDEGYIIKTITAAEAIKGQLMLKKVSVTAVDGDLVTFESKWHANSDIGETADVILPEDCEIYMLEADCEAHFIGEATDHLKLGDRCYVYADFDGNVKMIFVERRMVESEIYYNIGRQYDSTKLETSRTPVGGYYIFEMAVNGKQIKVKTKDKALATKIDAVSAQVVGLKLNGDIIEEVYGNGCVVGAGSNSNRFIVDIMGSIVRMVPRDDWAGGSNYMLAADCQVYDITNNCNVPIGSVTELQNFDWLHCALLNEKNEITHMFVKQRYIEDGKLVYHLNQQYDSEKKETARTPDAKGYYVFEMLCEGKKITMKTKDKSVASWIDKNKYPVTVRLSGEIIKGVYSGASCVKGGTTWRVIYDSLNEERMIEYKTALDGDTIVGKIALPENLAVYNYSLVYKNARGEKTSLQRGDYIYGIYSREDYDLEKIFVYTGREHDGPLYWHVARRYNKELGETKRVPDADGWYVYELAVGGQVKTFKTKDKAIANKVDGRSSAFTLILKGDIILDMLTYPYAKGIDGTAAAQYTVTAINGNKITAKNLNAGETFGDMQTVTLAKNCYIYNVSPYAEKFGAVDKLALGDRIYCYTNKDGKAAYVYITAKNAREKGVESYCEHCDKTVVWQPFVGSVAKTDTHYYLPADRKGSQITLGYNATELEQNPDLKPYEFILDLNGKNFESATYRAFLLYNGARLTVMDSVGTGTVKAGTVPGTGGVIRTSGKDITINIYGGKLYADETCAVQSRGGLIYGSGYTLNMYGGELSGGVVEGTESQTKPGGGVIYIGSGAINIYGGTISGGTALKNEYGSGRGGTIFALKTAVTIAGGTINGGEASGNGGGINMDNCTFKMTGGTISGGKSGGVGGSVYASNSKMELAGGTINGDVYVPATTELTVSGSPVVSGLLTLPKEHKITLGAMKQGASIKLAAEGVFTNENANAAQYKDYFKVSKDLDVIEVTDDGKALNYNKYVAAGPSLATCPGCGEAVTEWLPVTTAPGDNGWTADMSGHYYLAEDISSKNKRVFSFPAGTDVCLHLNGNDITSTCANKDAITLRVYGKLRLMGEGTVSSGENTTAMGPVVPYTGGSVEIYGGTYVTNTGRSVLRSSGGTFAVKGGTFSTDPSSYVANGFEAKDNGDGTFTVVEGAGGPGTQPGQPSLPTTCPGCGQTVAEWTAVTAAPGDNGWTTSMNGHYYLENNIVGENKRVFSFPAGTNVCLHLNGNNIISNATQSSAITLRVYGTLRLMGEGTVSSGDNTAAMAPVVAYTGGSVEIYGGTYVTNTGEPVLRSSGGTFTVKGGTFDTDPSAYVPSEGYTVTESGGKFVVQSSGGNVPTPPATETCPGCNASVVWTELDQAAYEALPEEESLKLLASGHYRLTSTITGTDKRTISIKAGQAVCIDLNGKDIKNTCTSAGGGTIVCAGTLNIVGNGNVTCDVPNKEGATTGVIVANGGTVTLFGGTYTATNSRACLNTNGGGTLNVKEGVSVTKGYLVQMDTGAMNVEGGTFGTTFRIKNDATKVVITGGTFTAANPTAYVPTVGYTITESEGTYTVERVFDGNTVVNDDLVFAQGTTDAKCPICGKVVTWTAVTDEMDTMTTGHYYLTKSMEKNAKLMMSVEAENTVTLHLNGFNFANTYTANQGARAIECAGTLNILGNGIVSAAYANKIGSGTVTASGGTVNLYGGTYQAQAAGNVSLGAINNGQINVYAGATVKTLVSTNVGTFNIYGGTFEGYFRRYNATEASTLNISGGTFTNETMFHATAGAPATTVITGGSFKVDPTAYVDTAAYDITLNEGVYTVTQKSA